MLELPTNATERLQGPYTHRFDVSSADLTQTGSGTAQTLTLKSLVAGLLIRAVALIVTQGFENTASAANNHTTVSVGDSESNTQYTAAAEANGIGLQTFTDGVTNSTTTLTSATAGFTAADVGNGISGSGIPSSTTIAAVASSTSITLSAAATATATGVSISITGRGPVVYQAAAASTQKVYNAADNLTLTLTPASGTALTALNQGTLTVLAQIVNLADLE
jgi:hypothetical protein